MNMPTNPALRYHGGKWRIATWVISHMAQHTCYVETHGGAMSVLLRKVPSHLEVYNDLDQEVVTFFRVLRERPNELIRAIALTPFSRVELAQAFESAGDELERARRLYIRAWQGRGGPRAMWRTGWRFQRVDARGKRAIDDWNEHARLWSLVDRLKHVQIENDDALAILRRYDHPGTLFYVDPPYVHSTRSTRWNAKAYTHEMTDDDHRALAAILHDLRGMVLLSGYHSPLYDELYADWDRDELQARDDKNSYHTEVLWLSPAIQRARMPLFSLIMPDRRGGPACPPSSGGIP